MYLPQCHPSPSPATSRTRWQHRSRNMFTPELRDACYDNLEASPPHPRLPRAHPRSPGSPASSPPVLASSASAPTFLPATMQPRFVFAPASSAAPLHAATPLPSSTPTAPLTSSIRVSSMRASNTLVALAVGPFVLARTVVSRPAPYAPSADDPSFSTCASTPAVSYALLSAPAPPLTLARRRLRPLLRVSTPPLRSSAPCTPRPPLRTTPFHPSTTRLAPSLRAARSRSSTLPPMRSIDQLHGLKIRRGRIPTDIFSPSAVVFPLLGEEAVAPKRSRAPPSATRTQPLPTFDMPHRIPPCRHSSQPSPSRAPSDSNFVRRGAPLLGCRHHVNAAPTESPRTATRAHTDICGAAPRSGNRARPETRRSSCLHLGYLPPRSPYDG
ncbi:hypothetical protein DFH09DRAFT_1368029 [Mycena vulgaris]|nr:hypothetical protein DFH09DRAFT_1368029 [Mycena vulgaris]